VRVSSGTGMGLAGALVVGVAFGMARYAYGLTLPAIRENFGLSEVLLGFIASATFVGFLGALLLAGPLASRWGSRAPTTVGGFCGVLGAALVAVAQTPWMLAIGAALAGSAGGWVWAPYSDIVTRTLPRRQQSRVLAIITTGTSGGLVLLGGLSLLAAFGSWRLVWSGIAIAALTAAVINLRLVPRVGPLHGSGKQSSSLSILGVLRRPALYSTVYFAAIVVYFTYAADTLGRSTLQVDAVPLLYAVIGVCGVVAVATGAYAQRLGSHGVGALCLIAVGGALALLGLASDSLAATVVSACIFGIGYMTGSAVLALWTAELVPDRAGAAFTTCLVVGAVISIGTPVVAGAAITAFGLVPVLLTTAALSVLSGIALLLTRTPQSEGAGRPESETRAE
jgi:predicted MFS family arabinose efflux permease